MTAMTSRADRGSAGIWVLSGSAIVLLIAIAVIVRGDATLVRHRAQNAADASALAAAGQIGISATPCSAASAIATANGARLQSCQLVLASDARSGQVAVVVAIALRLPIVGASSVQGRARAERLAE